VAGRSIAVEHRDLELTLRGLELDRPVATEGDPGVPAEAGSIELTPAGSIVGVDVRPRDGRGHGLGQLEASPGLEPLGDLRRVPQPAIGREHQGVAAAAGVAPARAGAREIDLDVDAAVLAEGGDRQGSAVALQ